MQNQSLESIIKKRKLINKISIGISYFFAIIGISTLLFIIGSVIFKGLFSSFGMYIFINDSDQIRGIGNGLRHAIIGQLILSFGASFLAIPIGLLAGTYIREYSTNQTFIKLVRNSSDLLNSTPTIIIATFIFAIMVMPMGHTSGYAGILALMIIMIPIILKTTDDMLSLVPLHLKEAAMALGAPKHKMITQVVYRAAKNGLITGILLAFCRITGESAPLLFTASYSNFLSFDLNENMPSLSIAMYNFATSPQESFQNLGWNAAFLLTSFILAINIIARIIVNKKKIKKYDERYKIKLKRLKSFKKIRKERFKISKGI